MRKILLFISLISVLSISGCSSPLLYESQFQPYESGTIEGQNLKIEAIDGSFSLSEGRFAPPFQTTPMTPIVWTSIYSTLNSNSRNYSTTLLDSFDFALEHGAQKVLVHYSTSEEPLYGVMLLNKKHNNATGAAARSYLIRVPNNYITAAKGGRVSVIYEPVSRSDREIKMYGWVLWLSDAPF